MGKLNRLHQLTGWLVFAIATVVYLLSAERTGSLWDCGEFVLGAYKMQVVHPPGAPLFLLIGRMFAGLGDVLGGSNQAMIAYAVNAMSGVCTAFAAAFVAWITIRFSILTILGRSETAELGSGQNLAVAAGGLVAGLATAFSTSIWFSAVEGEVYAMSTFFTCLTIWAMVRWYTLADTPAADRWLLFALFASGLSIGVHLLSILTIPAMAIFYYYKKNQETSLFGLGLSVVAGVVIIVFIQAFIIVGIPTIWQFFEIPLVNTFRLPVHSGIIPTLLLLLGAMYLGLRYAHRNNVAWLQQVVVGFGLLVIAFSTVGVVVLRAEAKTPVNMNNPDNVTSLLPYLNREQYGERSLIYGQTFTADVTSTEVVDRYGLVDGKYEKGVTQKITPEYSKKMLFSRMYDNTQGRVSLYKQWMGLDPSQPLPRNRPNQADNIQFLFQYQIGWMYWRYFMWNFAGRQNGEQGFYSWDKSSGNWVSGIKPLDEARLGNLDELPDHAKNDPAHNRYYLLPFLFGLIGLFWHARKNSKDFIGLLTLFVITGIGIIIYTNQPPNEPRERDYVLVGSFFTFCIWMGMAVPALYGLAKDKLNQKGFAVAAGIGAVVLVAPLLMGFQNWDDHSRALHSGARDYAANFLESVDQNAIIFTYGDNDTYPLWYAQEVENIRPDVRVVNLSLIAVDWYIDLLRYKMNDSPPINLTLTEDQYRGRKRNQIPYLNRNNPDGNCARDTPQSLEQFMATLASENPVPLRGGGSLETQYASCNVGIQVDPRRLAQAPWLVPAGEQAQQRIPIRISNSRLLKDDIAILDIINSNLYDRPIYWAVTCQQSKLLGLEDYLQLEGLALKLTVTPNAGDQRNYGIIGSGGIDAEKTADLVLNKWQWGNFDNVDTHISTSYAPAVQSMQIVIMRTMRDLVDNGQLERALEVGDAYFRAFPDKNFPFFYQTYLMLQPYLETRNAQRAAPVIEQLARNAADRMDFYNSIDESIRQSSYQSDITRAESLIRGLLQQIRQQNAPELQASVEQILGAYLYMAPGETPGTLE
ncbi:DUF2723 domain-containing protein [Neolewinella lacunae]|uniref:DUF2723 domain-containing protein n=1 Tax=Neolewinella lacunae TaxID=1517758 RepID=A0A923PQF5_9BACT|nr:DUF2723 domain-containing protein [Neolewinella lacunae]MBC6995584.1 DUF2723 domain-containing protein [Neolewinella lacunae]MDN3635620.1 DUF2723 domain-containing protein [Neolewinella lacunae]